MKSLLEVPLFGSPQDEHTGPIRLNEEGSSFMRIHTTHLGEAEDQSAPLCIYI